jgi:two-component system cell cycle sensor histidine kinase/response regulator CckA
VERRAEALVRLFEAAHEGVYIGTLDSVRSRTIIANPQLKSIFGFAPRAAAGDVRPFDPERFVDREARRSLIERLRSEGSIVDYPMRLRRLDETLVWVEVNAIAQPARSPGTIRIEALVRDVTSRRKLDDETRGLTAQLLQAEKMAALGQTVSGVAHELNNPLATILSWSERLSQNSNTDPSTRRGLEVILREAERAARIVRALLTSARKRQSTRAMVDVNAIVRETLALRSRALQEATITLVETLDDELPPIFADGYQLQQVLLNLAINAEQAMLAAHGRGVLEVRTAFDSSADTVTIDVKDDGPGIPEAVQSRMFEPFFTTKGVGAGTGLGLTVAYAIVQDHGGRIHLDSRPGSGTAWHVELPRSGAPSIPATAAATTTAAPTRRPGPTASILLVEDERSLAAAVMDMLKDAGYTVTYAADGRDALTHVERTRFDLVICDLKMPHLDGKELFRVLSAKEPRLAKRIIFVTGDVAGDDSEAFLAQSGCRYLAKPFRAGDLLRTVVEALS